MEHLKTTGVEFPVDADSIRIVKTPSEFYELILERIGSAKNRVYLSSLYLGSGELETAIVDGLSRRLDENESLDVTILLDFLRGTRGEKEGKSSTNLLTKIAHKAKVYLFHTPELRGALKSILGERNNEIIGLQHMKLYIFDDALLISGANLSDSYFTDRQDRYVLIENSKQLADFFCSIISAVGSHSFELDGEGKTKPHIECDHHPFQGNSTAFCTSLRDRVLNVVKEAKETNIPMEGDTVVYPLLQMGMIGIDEEYDFLKRLLASKDSSLEMTLASGYFNATQEYERLLLCEGDYSLKVLMAAPDANGFAGASGLSRYIPSMYSSIAASFLAAIDKHNRERVELLEWSRKGWSFHAKGIWCDRGNRIDTIIGSSNYGYRSLYRDLEAQIVVSTTNASLMNRLREERNGLLEFSSVVDRAALRRVDHHVPTLVSYLSKVLRRFF
ncbi:hypothetical protein PFISCL1PPCAC_1948 [Pristionchus fissidentatus]|uniref:CDP-diacylglycerol--glycerol-3-phosphate 3-phosphatidyltransferase n=1 Tax=Pristionchus fissidentatus TaxID=1538716 RepID=A0AAV5UTT9_9BILA|nr:hypothetical protein PFISCL1PPCAC_1948 [Pristionchus fissidentatus]